MGNYFSFSTRIISILFGVFIFLGFLSVPKIVLADGEAYYTPITVNSFSITPLNAHVGDTITFTVKITENLTSLNLEFRDYVNHYIKSFPMQYTEQDPNTWIGTYIVTDLDPVESWYVSVLFSSSSLSSVWYRKLFTQNDPTTTFNIIITPPLINNISINSQSVNIGDQINLQTNIYDPNKQIIFVKVEYTTASDNTKQISMNYDTNTKLWKANYAIQSFDNPGLWKFTNISSVTQNGGVIPLTVTNPQNLDFTVNAPVVNVTAVSLNKNTATLGIGSSETLIATLNPTNVTNKNLTWKSSDPTIATVDSMGKVTGVKAGNSTITVTTLDGSKTASCVVTVDSSIVVNSNDQCFIATAAYGSKYQQPVVLLRHFRDKILLTNPLGTEFVKWYYHNSPPLANFIAGHWSLKMLVRVLLIPLVVIAFMALNPWMLVVLLVGFVVWRKRKILVKSN